MSAGTLTLTNNSSAVGGTGTTFTTELASGDFVVVTVGGVPYTLPIKTVNSNTSLTLVSNFTGPTQSGAAWSAVPRVALNMVTAALVAQSAEALRGLNYDKQNWQRLLTENGEVTIILPDGSTFTGPSWMHILSSVLNKNNNLSDLGDIDTARNNLELGKRTGAYFGGVNLDRYSDVSTDPSGIVIARKYNAAGTVMEFYHRVYSEVRTDGIAYLTLHLRGQNATNRYLSFSEGGDLDIPGLFKGGSFEATSGPHTFKTAVTSNMQTTISAESGYAMLWRRNHGVDKADEFIGIRSNSDAVFRKSTGATTYIDASLWHTANTTVDASGFIKKASPIVKIFRNGEFEVNHESEGCEVIRISEGEYQITGCMGLNADLAWGGIEGGFELPRDRNGQPLLWVDYSVSEDGSLLIKTMHRTHDSAPEFARNIKEGYSNGDMIDIPADSFVSVRVEMPINSKYNMWVAYVEEQNKQAEEAEQSAAEEAGDGADDGEMPLYEEPLTIKR
jgi:hypothetical protein